MQPQTASSRAAEGSRPRHFGRYVTGFCGCHKAPELDSIDQMSQLFLGMVGKRLTYRDLVGLLLHREISTVGYIEFCTDSGNGSWRLKQPQYRPVPGSGTL